MQTTTSKRSLAFLPLFGEDWNLDSLTIYGTSELATPEWCENQNCGNSICATQGYLIVPADADVVYRDENTYQLPPMPKPLLIFGTSNYVNIKTYGSLQTAKTTLLRLLTLQIFNHLRAV